MQRSCATARRAQNGCSLPLERPQNTRRQILEDALVGCSLVNLLYIDVWRLLFAAKNTDAFFLTIGPLHYLAALLTVLAGGVLMVLAGWLVRRSPRLVQIPLRLAFLASVLIVLDRIRKSSDVAMPALMSHVMPALHALGKPGLAVAAIIIAALVAWFAFPLSRAYRMILLVLSPFVVFTLAKAPWMMATVDFAQFRDLPRPVHPGVKAPSRAVIIVLDELDYENLYLKRPKDLQLPNFDALLANAVSFDSAITPGANTLESLSSYLLQRRVERLENTGPRSFVAHLYGGGSLASDTARSVFAQPAAMGAKIGVIGFSLPYCRLDLAAAADFCDWVAFGNGVGSSPTGDKFWHVVLRQLQTLHPYDNRRAHIRRTKRVLEKSVQFASDSTVSIAFLHLPLPHLPPIWDRKTNEFQDHSTNPDGYFDNLALADRVIGQIREGMVKSGTWASSTVVVMSDHPERTKLASKQSTDRRIPLFVKLPGMETGTRITDRVNSLFVTSLLPDLMAGRIRDAAALRTAAIEYARTDPSLLNPPKDLPTH
jgi:hypothetical protein